MKRIKVDFNEIYNTDCVESLYQANLDSALRPRRGEKVIAFCCCTEMDATYLATVKWLDGSQYYRLRLKGDPREVQSGMV